MSCHDDPIDFDDDEPGDICDACLEQQLLEFGKFEPGDDPQPRNLLPVEESTAIERHRPDKDNVARVFHSFCGLVDAIRNTPRGKPLTEADLLEALEHIVRSFAMQQIVERMPLDMTAAYHNRTKILSVLQLLYREFHEVGIPTPHTN